MLLEADKAPVQKESLLIIREDMIRLGLNPQIIKPMVISGKCAGVSSPTWSQTLEVLYKEERKDLIIGIGGLSIFVLSIFWFLGSTLVGVFSPTPESTSTTASSSLDASSSITETEVPKPNVNIQQIKKGEQIFRDIQSHSPAVMQVRGGANDDATATLAIPKTLWDSLSKKDQVSLTFYAESLIPDIRANPNKYTDTPPDAVAYRLTVNNIGKICDGCWEITVGRVNSDRSLMADTVVVQGDEGWNKEDWIKEGIKASEFRNETFKKDSPTPTMEKPATESPSQTSTSPTIADTSSPSTSPATQDICHRPYQALYMEIYLQCIHEGMSHAEVSAVVGNPGEEVSNEGSTVIYQWHGGGKHGYMIQDSSAIMTVTFQDDQLVSKSGSTA